MLKVRYQPLRAGDSGMTQSIDELNIDENQLALDIAREIDAELVQDLAMVEYISRFRIQNYLYDPYDDWYEKQFPNHLDDNTH